MNQERLQVKEDTMGVISESENPKTLYIYLNKNINDQEVDTVNDFPVNWRSPLRHDVVKENATGNNAAVSDENICGGVTEEIAGKDPPFKDLIAYQSEQEPCKSWRQMTGINEEQEPQVDDWVVLKTDRPGIRMDRPGIRMDKPGIRMEEQEHEVDDWPEHE